MSVIYCDKCCKHVDTDFYYIECNGEEHEEL